MANTGVNTTAAEAKRNSIRIWKSILAGCICHRKLSEFEGLDVMLVEHTLERTDGLVGF